MVAAGVSPRMMLMSAGGAETPRQASTSHAFSGRWSAGSTEPASSSFGFTQLAPHRIPTPRRTAARRGRALQETPV